MEIRSLYFLKQVSLNVEIILDCREEANQIVKTLLAYGYNLEPPTSEMGESSLRGNKMELFNSKIPTDHLMQYNIVYCTWLTLRTFNLIYVCILCNFSLY